METQNDGNVQTPDTDRSQGGGNRSPAYALYVAVSALSLAAAVTVLAMFIFRDLFTDASAVTAALSTLFTLIGTLVGAYFGIKLSNDTAERCQRELEVANERIEKANDKARAAYRERPTSG